MNIKNKLQKDIFETIGKLCPEADLKLEDIEILYPPEQFGDYSCNAAMKLAPKLKKNPFEIAEQIRDGLLNAKNSDFEKIEVARPGHLNFFLSKEVLFDNLKKIEKEKEDYGKSPIGKGKRVMVEFGQPNTHKAFHVGHLRSGISGLAVANLFEAIGYEVIRVNYYGDVGMHVAKTTWAIKKEGIPGDFESWNNSEKMKYIDQMYVKGSKDFKGDEESQKEIRKINKAIYAKDDSAGVYSLYEKIRQWSLDHLNDMFLQLGIEYDKQYPESEVYPQAIEIVEKNIGKIFKKSQGAIVYDGSADGLTTWVFLTKEGVPTYSAKDLALADRKFSDFNPDLSIVTTSVEQMDYFKVVIHCLELIKPALEGKYKHIPFGWLLRNSKKTSSRMGDSVKGSDVIAEAKNLAEKEISSSKEYDQKTKADIVDKVALSGLKFLILSHEFQNNINYDPEQFIKLKGFSGPFILYSYVRTQSILRKVSEPDGKYGFEKISFEPAERNLLKELLIFPEIIEQAGLQTAPHLVCNYLYTLAQKLNIFYENCPIQGVKNGQLKKVRLSLVRQTGQVLKNGLGVLGIETVDYM